MVGDDETRAAWQRARQACAASALELREAGIALEALAEYVPERGTFLWRRKATMRPLGEAWRLGTLLLGADGALYAHGHSTRSAERGRPSYQSESREVRREIAAAALHGGYPVGTPVNYDATQLLAAASGPGQADFGGEPTGAVFDPDHAAAGPDSSAATSPPRELPVGLAEGEVRVRWRAGAPLTGAQTLEAFLAERVELLINPPFARN